MTRLVLLLALLAWDPPRQNSLRPAVSDVPVAGELLDLRTHDVNGDGRKDLLVLERRGDGAREIAVHLQAEESRFRADPDRRIRLKKDIVAWSVGDVVPDPGAELLLFTARSCFAYRTAKEGYRAAATRLFAWDFVGDIPDPRDCPFIPCTVDVDGDGDLDVFVPGPTSYGLFVVDGGEWTARRPLAVPVSRGAD